VVILGIETSCDETSVALVRDGREVLVNLVASQVKLHERFGGVVPELASRAHLHLLAPMIEEALSGARLSLNDVDAIAVTQGPGLIGALLVGVETAKALSFSLAKPLIPVHHIAAHLMRPFCTARAEPTGASSCTEAQSAWNGPRGSLTTWRILARRHRRNIRMWGWLCRVDTRA